MISTYLNQTATLNRSGAVAADGSRTTMEIPIRCRFEYGTKRFLNRNGELVTCSATVFAETQVLQTDTIVYDGETWLVLRVMERRGFNSVSHYEVFV